MAAPNALNAESFGLSTNSNGGTFKNGVHYDIKRKLEVVDKYQELVHERNGFGTPSYREVAREVKVFHTYVKKVIDELNSEIGILDAQFNKPQRLKGHGARSLDSYDVAYLITLLRQNPSRTLESYR